MPSPKITPPLAGWSDDHEESDHAADQGAGDPLWERPAYVPDARFVPRIGVGGATREVNRAFSTAVVAWLMAAGRKPLVLTLDTHGWDEAIHLRSMLHAILDPKRIVGVAVADEHGRAVLAIVANELIDRFLDADVLLYSGSDAVSLIARDATLAHYTVDIQESTHETTDLTYPAVLADLRVIHTAGTESRNTDIHVPRSSLPTVIADCISGKGLEEAFAVLWEEVLG